MSPDVAAQVECDPWAAIHTLACAVIQWLSVLCVVQAVPWPLKMLYFCTGMACFEVIAACKRSG